MGQMGLFDKPPEPKPDPEAWRRAWPTCILCGVQDRGAKVWYDNGKVRGSAHYTCVDELEAR